MIEAFVMLGGLCVFLFLLFVWNSFKENKRKWKIRKGEDHSCEYLELDENGIWRSISFSSEAYSKNYTRHVIYIPKNWGNYPDWAKKRKEEILNRLKSVLKEPEYTYIETD